MNILFCGDENVCQGIFLSVLSICKNVNQSLNFYILTAAIGNHTAIPQSFCDNLQAYIRKKNKGHQIILLNISEKFSAEIPEMNMNTRFTPLCMLRLSADEVPEIPDKILYLDTDVLCCADFSCLFEADMKGAEIAGVPDRYGKWFFGNILRHDYLNSGVLLMDMKKIRESGLFKECRKLCRNKKMFMPDQTALNKLAVKQKLPRRFNNQGKIKNETVFKHFTTFFKFFPYIRAVTVKPWETDKLHNELGIYEFDDIIEEYKRSKER